MNEVQPVKDMAKIEAMKKILRADNIRDWLLFTIGINVGLRIRDLLSLKVSDVVDEKYKPKRSIYIQEGKTGKTRKIELNKVVRKAITEYIEEVKPNLDDYLFKSRKGNNKPISRVQAWQIIKDAAKLVGIQEPIGTHTLRKTFGYHAFIQGTDITLLQKVFNHSTPGQTLRYIGITQEDIDKVYINLNL